MQGRIDLLVVHSLLHDHNLARVGCTTIDSLPAFPEFGRVFEDSRMLEDTAGTRTIGEEGGAVFLASQSHAHGISCHSYGRVAHQAVKAQSRNV